MTVKGLRLSVARTVRDIDCTLGGVTALHDELTLIGTIDNFDREVTLLEKEHYSPFSPSEDAPAVALHIRTFGLDNVASIVPVTLNPETEKYEIVPGIMAGGNYAGTTDSRMTQLLKDKLGHTFYGALSVHDRIER